MNGKTTMPSLRKATKRKMKTTKTDKCLNKKETGEEAKLIVTEGDEPFTTEYQRVERWSGTPYWHSEEGLRRLLPERGRPYEWRHKYYPYVCYAKCYYETYDENNRVVRADLPMVRHTKSTCDKTMN